MPYAGKNKQDLISALIEKNSMEAYSMLFFLKK